MIKKSIPNLNKKKVGSGIIRLQFALPAFFTLFLLLTGATIFSFNYVLPRKYLEEIATEYIKKTGTTVLNKTINHLAPAYKMVELNGEQLKPKNFSKTTFETFNILTIPQFRNNPQFALIYLGTEEGNFYMNGLDPNGSISTQVITRLDNSESSDNKLKELKYKTDDKVSLKEEIAKYLKTTITYRNSQGKILKTENVKDYIYDPRWRPWYKNAKKSKGTSWTGAYQFSSSGRYYASGKTGITVSTPVYNDKGNLTGVVGIDIFLEELSKFLKQLEISENGKAFIINSNRDLIAFTNLISTNDKEPEFFTNINDISDKIVHESITVLDSIENLTKERSLVIPINSNKYLAYFAPIPMGAGPQWVVGVIAPEDDFIGKLKEKLLISMLVAFGIIVVMVIISMIIGNKITIPIKHLMEDALLIKDLNLKETTSIPSIFTEIEDMNLAFKNMKIGLKSFKKYIPSDVVRYLINSGNEAILGGEEKKLTIFFSDVADFTTISEQLAPGKLVGHLGDYLDKYSKIIESTGGTVDKFIGDGVMAFWNAPGNIENHYEKSCEAALLCIEGLKKLHESWNTYDLPLLYTRIGIHTGNVIVGNMGSSERLNYTIIGDSVNLASRLEGLAKIYGVHIIVSEATKLLAKNSFVFRKLDKVLVKGKTIPVTIYELICKKEDITPDDISWIENFESGLHLYFNKQWNEAKKFFKRCNKYRPEDKSSKLFIERINTYLETPPENEWDGVEIYNSKV